MKVCQLVRKTRLLYNYIIFNCILLTSFEAVSFQKNSNSGDRLFALGDSCYYEGNYLNSISFYKQALREYIHSKDSSKIAKSLNDIGVSFKKVGEFDSAKHYYEQAIIFDRLTGDSIRLVNDSYNLSNLYKDKGNYSKASAIIIECLTIARRNNNAKAIARLTSSLGSIYFNHEEYDRALIYYHQAKQAYERVSDTSRINTALNNIGMSHTELKQWDSAFYYLHLSLRGKQLKSNSGSIAFTLHNLGSLYHSNRLYDSAEYYFQKAYKIRNNLSDNYKVAVTGNELGQLYLDMGRPSDAIVYLLEARSYADSEENYTILIDNIDAMNDYYLMIGDTAKAYQALNQWSVLKDSLYTQEKVKVMELQSAFELNRKEEERKKQEEEALSQSRLAEQRLVIIAIVTGAALLLVLLVLFVIRQRSKIKRLNENLKLVNRDMYHRKKNDYMRLLDEISETNVTISEDIKGKLLASAAVDESLYEEAYDMVELSDYLEERLDDIGDAQGLSSKEVVLKATLSKVKVNGQVATAVLLVLNELMTNSVKHSFADRGGIIHITIAGEGGRLRVIYKDDGAPFVSKVKGVGMGQKIIEQVLKTLRSELSREVQGQWNLSSFEIKV